MIVIFIIIDTNIITIISFREQGFNNNLTTIVRAIMGPCLDPKKGRDHPLSRKIVNCNGNLGTL